METALWKRNGIDHKTRLYGSVQILWPRLITLNLPLKLWSGASVIIIIIMVIAIIILIIVVIISIIIALGNAPYKMLHKLKSGYSIRKKQLWTSESSSVSQKSRDQLSDPWSQQATHSNSWDQPQQRLSFPNTTCG